jgi:hypothetical protein
MCDSVKLATKQQAVWRVYLGKIREVCQSRRMLELNPFNLRFMDMSSVLYHT